jgi:UDP-N-acetylmuramoyl-L-alanyl-D-glutamate--2,6-diaminopimelate ligase
VSTLPVPQPNSVSLRRLFPSASFVESTDIVVADVTERSSECTPGCLFAAIPGTQFNGTTFASDAIANGAIAILADTPQPTISAPQCIVPDVRDAFSTLCQAVNRWPSRHMQVTGITGTNGKSTVAWLLRSILLAAGHRTGLLGTIEADDGITTSPTTLTTPTSKPFAEQLADMVDNQCSHAVVELSSHALDQSRVAGVSLAAAVVTNVTQDHFDYHGDFENYCDSKARIIDLCGHEGPLFINADDEGCEILAGRLSEYAPIRRFGIHCTADVRAHIQQSGQHGSRFTLTTDGEEFDVATALIGEHNVSNCLAAISVALELGVKSAHIITGIHGVKTIPGRLQRINLGQPFEVYVDYAHTDDALRRVIQAVRELTRGRIICVVGAGGNRDESKRPLLGQAAAMADVVIVTSDNPRDEDPDSIIDQIVRGIGTTAETIVQSDRATAIGDAMKMAMPNDTILIVGKGHETTQTIGDMILPFDDRVVGPRAH